MPAKQRRQSKKSKWAFLKHPFFIVVAGAVATGLITLVVKNLTNSPSLTQATSSSTTANVGGNNYGQVAGHDIINQAGFSKQTTKTNPTIQEEITYYSRIAQARQWQPPELPKNAPWIGNDLYPIIRFGGITSQWAVGDEQSAPNRAQPIMPPGGSVIIPYIKNNRLYIKAQTAFGDAPNTVQMNNEWPVKIPDDWDRNFDENSFEIVDDKKLPVFQIHYNSPYKTEIYGIFVAPNGAITVAFGDDTEIIPPKFPIPKIPERKAWFKYPSTQFLGDHATN